MGSTHGWCWVMAILEKNGSGPCLHGTQHEVGTMKRNWSARGQYNLTGEVSM